jgi:hypothetical protein
MRLATALRDRGLQVLVPHGRADLEAAGLIFHTPAWKSPLPPAHPIWLTEEGAGQLGLSGRLPGWVQDVRWPAFEFRYDALLLGPAGLLRLEDLPEEALASRGPRGAAGLGELS